MPLNNNNRPYLFRMIMMLTRRARVVSLPQTQHQLLVGKAKMHRRWKSNGRHGLVPGSGLLWASRSPHGSILTRAVGPCKSSIEIQQQIPQFPNQQTIRGKKTRTVVSLDDLPQGLILPTTKKGEGKSKQANGKTTTAGLPLEENEPLPSPSYPTVMLQARRNMQKFDNCVLLTRVGGFYEIYFEQAQEYGPLLNLKVAQRKTAAGPVAMVNTPNSIFLLTLSALRPSSSCA